MKSFCHSSVSARSHRNARRAFTLVELLVVIGIIALLISILLPALNKAREAAKQIKCGANLHSIGEALAIYLQDSKGMCPIGFWDGTADPKTGTTLAGNSLTRKTNWGLLLMSSMTHNAVAGNAYDVGQQNNAASSKTLQMLQCPSVPADNVAKSNTVAMHYSAHPRIFANLASGTSTDAVTGRLWTTTRASRIKRSAEMATVFDGSLNYDAVNNVWAAAYDVPVAQGLDDGKLNITYTDAYGSTSLTDNMKLATYNPPVANTPVNMAGFYGHTAQANTDDAGGAYNNANNIRFRHIGNTMANVLMFDGHVEPFRFNRTSGVTDLLRKNVNVSY